MKSSGKNTLKKGLKKMFIVVESSGKKDFSNVEEVDCRRVFEYLNEAIEFAHSLNKPAEVVEIGASEVYVEE